VAGSNDKVFIGSVTATTGFAAITNNGATVRVGDSTISGSVTVLSTHELRIRAGDLLVVVENIDGFVNLRSVQVTAATMRLRSHGLLGQTWQNKTYRSSLAVIEGEVDDYAVGENTVFGVQFPSTSTLTG
jgi:hypothetical protein